MTGGVFVGISSNDYGQPSDWATQSSIDAYAGTGSALSIAANRLSYFLDLARPEPGRRHRLLLVAGRRASGLSEPAARGECDAGAGGRRESAALATMTVELCQGGFMAPDGRCKTFDASADGYVRRRGRRRRGAQAALARRFGRRRPGLGRHSRDSAINQDGRSNGLTAPNPQSQVRCAAPR